MKKLKKGALGQYVGTDANGDLRFRISSNPNEHLIISAKCYPKHEWIAGEKEFPLKRKTIIEMF